MHKTEGDRKVIEWMTPAPFSSMLLRFEKKISFFLYSVGKSGPGADSFLHVFWKIISSFLDSVRFLMRRTF